MIQHGLACWERRSPVSPAPPPESVLSNPRPERARALSTSAVCPASLAPMISGNATMSHPSSRTGTTLAGGGADSAGASFRSGECSWKARRWRRAIGTSSTPSPARATHPSQLRADHGPNGPRVRLSAFTAARATSWTKAAPLAPSPRTKEPTRISGEGRGSSAPGRPRARRARGRHTTARGLPSR